MARGFSVLCSVSDSFSSIVCYRSSFFDSRFCWVSRNQLVVLNACSFGTFVCWNPTLDDPIVELLGDQWGFVSEFDFDEGLGRIEYFLFIFCHFGGFFFVFWACLQCLAFWFLWTVVFSLNWSDWNWICVFVFPVASAMHRVGSAGNTSSSTRPRKEKRLSFVLSDADDTKVRF